MGGAAAMGSFMLIIACIVATHPPNPNATEITGTGVAAIAMVYAEVMAFNFSWGPLAWLYIGEIFPSRIREVGVACGAASQWLFNFMMSQVVCVDQASFRSQFVRRTHRPYADSILDQQ